MQEIYIQRVTCLLLQASALWPDWVRGNEDNYPHLREFYKLEYDVLQPRDDKQLIRQLTVNIQYSTVLTV